MSFQFSKRVPTNDSDPVGDILKVAAVQTLFPLLAAYPHQSYFRLTL